MARDRRRSVLAKSTTGRVRDLPVAAERAIPWLTSMSSATDSASSSTASDESELLRRAATGDGQAFRELANALLAPVLRFAWRLLGSHADAEEIAQETLLRLWQQAPRWEPRARVKTWVFRVAHNLCVDALRRRRKSTDAASEPASHSVGPGALMEHKELAEAVQAALLKLPEKQRAALVLMQYDGFTQSEAAAVLELSVSAVESLVARARRTLRQELSDLANRNEATESADPPRSEEQA